MNLKHKPAFAIPVVVARIFCFFLGHKIPDNRTCKRCKSEFGVPRMRNPPSPP